MGKSNMEYMENEEDLRRDVLKHPEKYGFKRIILSQESHPDLVVETTDGEILRVELETYAYRFRHHKTINADLVLCVQAWEGQKEINGVPVKALAYVKKPPEYKFEMGSWCPYCGTKHTIEDIVKSWTFHSPKGGLHFKATILQCHECGKKVRITEKLD